MSTTSTRQQLFTKILDRLALIQKANGFNTDAGLTILFQELPELGPDDPGEAIALLLDDDQLQDHGDDILVVLPFRVAALARAGAADLTPGLVVEQVLSDIKRAIEDGNRTLDQLLTRDLKRGRTRAMPREEGSTTIGVSLMYTAVYLDKWAAA